MWYLTGNPKTKRVTHDLAEKFTVMDAAPQDRLLSENRMRVYEKLIREGSFRPCTWAAAYCKQTGATYRVNGKHTATLMSRLDPLPELYVVEEFYECDTLEDVSRLYSTFDSKLQSRNVDDINRSFASCVAQLDKVDLRTIRICIPAFWYSTMLERYRNLQPAERAEAILEHWDFVVWLHKLLGAGNRSPIKRMPVIAAIYLTWQKAPRIAEEFWTEVRDETGTKPTDPSRKLARFLILNSGMAKRGPGARYRIDDREYFVKSLHAWNAYRAGAPTNLNYKPEANVPAVK